MFIWIPLVDNVEVECPSCEGEVEVPNLDGHYACPMCNAVFEYEVDDNASFAEDEDGFDWMDVAIWLWVIFFFGISTMVILFGEPCNGPGCGGGP